MRYGFLASVFLVVFGAAWALAPDATREQVLAELGKPTSVAKLGGREIMIYPKGVRLELEGGKVVAAKGIASSDGVAEFALPAQPAKAVVAKTKTKTEKDDDDEPAMTDKERNQQAAENAAAEKELAEGQAKMMKTVEDMANSHEQGQQPPPPRDFDVLGFVLQMGLSVCITVMALKLSCKYWGAEVEWSALFKVAAADLLVRGSLIVVFMEVLGFPSMFYADEAVASIVMVLLLKKLSFNHSTGQAVTLMFTTKTFTIVVGMFLITVLLRLLH